jgi:hypothetical protein
VSVEVEDSQLVLSGHRVCERVTDQRSVHRLNRTTEHSYTQAASCESAASELSAVLRASRASVTSGV